MKLKCVGGYADGKSFELPNYYKYGDVWRVPEYPKMDAEDHFAEELQAWRENRTPEYIQTKYHLYLIDKFKFASTQEDFKELIFLRPLGMSTWDAILHQFSK